MLEKGHLSNCYKVYKDSKYNRPLKWLCLGYMEACLVQFGVIESKDNGLADYVIYKKTTNFWGKEKQVGETREVEYLKSELYK